MTRLELSEEKERDASVGMRERLLRLQEPKMSLRIGKRQRTSITS
jgi:hypothetical protein